MASNMQIQSLPLFPLPAHVLPGGKLSLRIFESRYLRMVKESYQRDHAFGMCMLRDDGDQQTQQHILPIGTLIQICDFSQSADGMLGVVVEGIECFHINNVTAEEDELRVGNVECLPGWSRTKLPPEYLHLATKLDQLIQSHDSLSTLYPFPELEDASWIALRWLEMLPVNPLVKQALISETSPKQTLLYLDRMLVNEN